MKILAHNLYPSTFLLGYRIVNREPQKIGSVVIKGLFQGLNSPTPAFIDQQVPIFSQDIFFEDEADILRYEHDMVPFKPFADVIIFGSAHPPLTSPNRPTGRWFTILETNTGQKVEKEFNADRIGHLPTKFVFGWASREKEEEQRLTQAGQNLNSFNPELRSLPEEFNNQFYNGYERALSGDVPLPYFENGVQLTIRTERRSLTPPDPIIYTVQLPNSRPTVTLTILNNKNQFENQPISIVLDTVIIEPDADRYIVIWRGNWQFIDALRERYIQLELQGGL